MNTRTAIIFGATGLIGNYLLEELVLSVKYQKIKVFVRQTIGTLQAKAEEIVIDFSNPDTFSRQIQGDDIFICLGTTIKKAGSVERMEEIDRDLLVKLASVAYANGVKRISVVSSIGANAASSNYYLRIKGEMEAAIMKLKFENIAIVRPSMLLGERKEKRAGEIAGKIIMNIFSPLLLGKLKTYRAIHGRDVAKAMITILQNDPGKLIYESDELQRIADMN